LACPCAGYAQYAKRKNEKVVGGGGARGRNFFWAPHFFLASFRDGQRKKEGIFAFRGAVILEKRGLELRDRFWEHYVPALNAQFDT
jgi:hypothetical protein